jgi:hypothetical protein
VKNGERKSNIKSRALALALLLLQSCVEPFNPPSNNYDNLLVVDGIITNETKQHLVILSRTSPLNDARFIPEKDAAVYLQDSNGVSIALTETAPGIFMTPYMAGKIGVGYRLLIITSNGTKYTSKEVVLKDSSPIEKIYAKYVAEGPNTTAGVQIYLDTKDSRNEAHYYRWQYEGTYEIRTPYPSKFIWTGGNTLTLRTVAVNNCWASDTSKNVLIQSSQNFAEGKITAFPIKFIPSQSPELIIKYSILVKQYVMNEKSFLFWKQLKEINEGQGSLFDKQPGNIAGNVSSLSNKGEVVLGYFDASAVSMKREFFIPPQFSESGYKPPLYLQSCMESAPITIPIEKLGETMEVNKNSLIIADAGGDGPSVVFLLRIACCDCTSQGTNFKPSFWE